jgi:hypothetical protein
VTSGGVFSGNLVGKPALAWFLAQEMRRLTLFGTFFILLAALYFLWQHRFERSPEFPILRLSDLRALTKPFAGVEWLGPESDPTLRLRVDPLHQPVVAHFDLPNMTALDWLHVRYRISAKNLKPGPKRWQDGRCLIEWHPRTGGSPWENDPFGSARYSQVGEVSERIMRPDCSPAIPALRLENLGAAGDLELSLFEATVLRESLIWKIGRGFLLVGWLGWAIAWIKSSGTVGFIRPPLAAVIWLLMGIFFVIPGPWKDARSLMGSFQIGQEIATARDATVSTSRPEMSAMDLTSVGPVVLESVGEIPDQGDFTLRLKHYAQRARPLLHTLLLFAPTLAIACLVGRKPACSLAIILSLAIEAAQFAFGFGFDPGDVFDLVNDAVGIALAIWLYGKLSVTLRGQLCPHGL